jgi:septum site-determining protein MinC
MRAPRMKPVPAVEIKGSTLPVLRVVVRDGAATDALAAALARAQPLLAEAIAVLDLRELPHAPDAALADCLRETGVRFAGALVADGSEHGDYAALGLPVIEAAEAAPRERATAPNAPAVVDGAPPPPLVVSRPLRSGQRVYAQGRDLVVLAPVSRGAELIADGSVYAFVPLRGRVLAGAGGAGGARIVATALDAELVAVAGVYRTLESADTAPLAGRPVCVSLTRGGDGVERLVLAPADAAAVPPVITVQN